MQKLHLCLLLYLIAQTCTGQINQWMWVGGDTTAQAEGYDSRDLSYPPKGTKMNYWQDREGNLWKLGDSFYTFWTFNVNTWRWKRMESNIQDGPLNRDGATRWTDPLGNFWLYGGVVGSSPGGCNDLWKFNGDLWELITGQPSPLVFDPNYDQPPVVFSDSLPDAREGAMGWVGQKGQLWLFGGDIYDGGFYHFNDMGNFSNDLWKFEGENWDLVKGTLQQNGPWYGEQGISSALNIPPSRAFGISWTGALGNFWIFGGLGPGFISFNDMWKFDGKQWLWVSGNSGWGNTLPIYGTKGIPAPDNIPGGRHSATHWVDHSGDLWIFGGFGYDKDGNTGVLNDLWKYDGINWTWMSGEQYVYAKGDYGQKGISGKSNTPSARKQAICWTDPTGDLWLYGGKIPETMTSDQKMYFNDLWKYNLSWPADVNAEVLLYPNPATDHITLKWDQAAPRHLFVYNIRSQRVIETGLLDWEERIEVRGLSPGLYRFLITEDGRYTAVSVVIK